MITDPGGHSSGGRLELPERGAPVDGVRREDGRGPDERDRDDDHHRRSDRLDDPLGRPGTGDVAGDDRARDRHPDRPADLDAGVEQPRRETLLLVATPPVARTLSAGYPKPQPRPRKIIEGSIIVT
jgi:hypothetical protein